MADFWKGDLLEYSKIGRTFTNLIKTLDETKVVSIEAGFGRGKTFFRKAWANQLRESGEIVVEIDAQKSDHSGDPLITLIAALVEELPREGKGGAAKALESIKKFGAIGTRAAARIALRSGADELIDAISEKVVDELGDFDALDEVVSDLGQGMSKAAGQMITAQMAAERVRKKELPEQLGVLQSALTAGSETDRVVILIDELDRCHPTYAIAVLEAMKLVFGQSGFVFCLMINAEYLEKLAQHQFGVSSDDEQYLDKFVDIRLRLQPKDQTFRLAVTTLARTLPLNNPLGSDEAFSLETAAELAGDLAVYTKLSMRKIKRVLLQVELAMRCYTEQPLDASLLLFLAFERSVGTPLDTKLLPRALLTPELGAKFIERINKGHEGSRENHRNAIGAATSYIYANFPELAQLPKDRYSSDAENYYDWAAVYQMLAPTYISRHQDALGAIADLLVD